MGPHKQTYVQTTNQILHCIRQPSMDIQYSTCLAKQKRLATYIRLIPTQQETYPYACVKIGWVMSIVQIFGVLLLSLPAQTALVEWCVLPSTIHVFQNQSCSTFYDLAVTNVDIAAMKGETENRQIIVNLKSTNRNALRAFAKITFKPLLHLSSSFSISNTSWQYWQVCYVNCKETKE